MEVILGHIIQKVEALLEVLGTYIRVSGSYIRDKTKLY